MPSKSSRKPSHKPSVKRPHGDRRPAWWLAITHRMDLAGRLAEHLEGRWQRWWGPAIMLTFPILLVILAFVVASLR